MTEDKDDVSHGIYFKLMTSWGTVLYFDQEKDCLRHGKLGLIPDNLRATIFGDELELHYPQDLGHSQRRTDRYKVFRNKADIAFSRSNLFACAEPDGEISISRTEASDWEYFLPLPNCITNPPPRDARLIATENGRNFKGSQPLKLYWWRHPSHVNLGDEMSPRIVAAVSGRNVIFSSADTADILAVGSILGSGSDLRRQTPTHVWGSGLMSYHDIATTRYVFSAVRGALTRACVSRSSDIPLGDPGLLTSCVWEGGKTKRYSWGIIPHHSHGWLNLFSSLRNNTPRSVLLDPTDPNIDLLIKMISECDFIASSSLHGLIIADSYGIPNVWIRTPNIHDGANFKFYDYFSSVGRPDYRQVVLSGEENLQSLEALLPSMDYLRNILSVQDSLINNFPEMH